LRGNSVAMRALHHQVHRVAPTTATVLLVGETGTGKEVVARMIHDLSGCREGPFVALNCGAFSSTLIESELFGHEQGSFTGASRRHSGVFEQADGGTLLLDEIAEMPVEMQVKLLRVLETGVFTRIGGEKSVQTNVRFIAATNRPADEAMRSGRLRQDLFYRLQVFPISLPPLREREADAALLAEHFLELLNREADTRKQFTAQALAHLNAQPWPGNVRQLRNYVQQAFILAERDIDAESVALPAASPWQDKFEVRVGSSIAEAEQQLIAATMERLHGNKIAAAKMLGISLKTLYCRLKLYAAKVPGSE
jgi:DNA-binding NtrC family response regulator